MKKLVVTSMVMVIVAVFTITGARAGSLEPSGPPGNTMHTLDDVYNVALDAYREAWRPKLWKIYTLDFESYIANARWGVADNGTPGDDTDDVVLDRETGLMWPRDANVANGTKTWEDAVTYCRDLTIGGRKGWRLPTIEELSSLVDPSQTDPALPAHPFINVHAVHYWSSSTYAYGTAGAWYVRMANGGVDFELKFNYYYVWPVRGGSGPILVPHTP